VNFLQFFFLLMTNRAKFFKTKFRLNRTKIRLDNIAVNTENADSERSFVKGGAMKKTLHLPRDQFEFERRNNHFQFATGELSRFDEKSEQPKTLPAILSNGSSSKPPNLPRWSLSTFNAWQTSTKRP